MTEFDRRDLLNSVGSGTDSDEIAEIQPPEESLLFAELTKAEWSTVEKQPVEVEARGVFIDPTVVETLEGDFEIDEEYIEEHGGYVLIRGVDGEVYPCALGIFERTYRLPGASP